MSRFSPIAVVGQGCVLPGALTPAQLWETVIEKRSALGRVPEGYWGLDAERVMTEPEQPRPDRTWSDRGGYVAGFDGVFTAEGFNVPAEELVDLDELFKWSLHAGREAILEAGHDPTQPTSRAGVVLGNKSFPTPSMAAFAEQVWREENGWPTPAEVDPRNRFMSGLPAQLLARALGLDGGAFSLDVACASSLYAVKFACDQLHDGSADLMLVGGINRADDLFLHIGFCALQALSRSGRSRPFHRDADGLLPAEGAAFVALKRLEDAEAAGDDILGIIRAVGLSNDGRSRGLLTPAEDGQVRAMRSACETAGIDPSDITLAECHATGTPVGDATEVRSMAKIFDGRTDELPIGSLKSNLGHLITASGIAGVLKVIAAMDAGVRPPTLHADPQIDALDGTPLRVLREQEAWEPEGLRRAVVNNFGFGGNNAQVILEEWHPRASSPSQARVGSADAVGVDDAEDAVAVVDMSVLAADGVETEDFSRALFHGESRVGPDGGRAESIELDVTETRFPPADLDQTLPQQLLILKAALQISETVASLPRERTGVLIGMGCDPEIARYHARWRLEEEIVARFDADALDGVTESLEAAGVLGTMPNLVANRINSQFDLGGASLSLCAEELSGPIAVREAARALRKKEIDAALVGAVDLSCEPVHRAAAADVLGADRQIPGDAAVVLVLKRLADACADGDPIRAIISDDASEGSTLRLGLTEDAHSLTQQFGHPHAASGLLHVAAAVDACYRKVRPPLDDRPAMPWMYDRGRRLATVTTDSVTEARVQIGVEARPGSPPERFVESDPPLIHLYSGADVASMVAALRADRPSDDGPIRLALVARSRDELTTRRELALKALRDSETPGAFEKLGPGVYLGDGSFDGEVAFVFTGPAGAYAGMGRSLLMAMPELADTFGERCQTAERAAGWVYGADLGREPDPAEKLWGASFLCQVHAEFTRHLLGLSPDAAIGFCAGETNALLAMGAWRDFDGLYEDLQREQIFGCRLGGDFEAVRDAWGVGAEDIDWQTWRVIAPKEAVRQALADEPRAYITIVNAPGDLVIGGDADAIARVVEAVEPKHARPLGYNIAIHSPATRAIEDLWRKLHTRQTHPVPGVRFYTHATGGHYEASREAVADALVGQAMNTVDFPSLIRGAWDDGIRIFVEHGPRAGCTHWIGRILEGRQHLAVSLDRTGADSLQQVVDTTARLAAAGLSVDHAALTGRLQGARPLVACRGTESGGAGKLSFDAHPPPVRLSRDEEASRRGPQEDLEPAETTFERMAPAPQLPPVFSEPPPPRICRVEPHPRGPRHPVESEGELYPSPGTGMSRRSRDVRSMMNEIHRETVRGQVLLHDQFLFHRERAARWLTDARMIGRDVPDDRPRQFDRAHRSAEQTVSDPGTMNTRQRPSHGVRSNAPSGPSFGRDELEVHAGGRISDIFGTAFRKQDDYERQVRMPKPPLLLVDRVTGIAARPAEMGNQGTIWTETDVADDSWYLHEGRMPTGLMVEAGQADLMLISWMGVDFLNQGERVYRLLGCELTFHGGLPSPGETLTFDIHIDGHARQGAVRIFFFHYDCHVDGEPRLTMREGQAGFFTDEELADSQGILWSADDMEVAPDARLDPPAVECTRSSFEADLVAAFAAGRAHECFGAGFERAAAHTSPPRIQSGEMRLIDEVEAFEPSGGPHGRGYLRAVQHVTPETWFFEGHFMNDPCMPGTLMLEGCVQAMSFYLAGLGYTLERDAWRFEPVPDEPCQMRCRGQVTPSSREVVYEVFVREVHEDPHPTVYADLLCTVDGHKAFHCRRLGLRLMPDYPLSRHPEWLSDDRESRPVASHDGVVFDEEAILACAVGRPSDAFGPMYRRFDGPRRAPRLPGPPYLFVSRVVDVEGDCGGMEVGSSVAVEYDVPEDAWYFEENAAPVMPFCVLLEVGLQPCGWLASYVGSTLVDDHELFFRNLDGDATVHGEVTPASERICTRATLRSLTRSGGMTIVAFDVEAAVDGETVLSMETVFGFFREGALARQAGLPDGTTGRASLDESSDYAADLTKDEDRSVGGVRLPDDRLMMIDRITGWWPEGGDAGLGRIRAEKKVDPADWYFKAHFFQDPVQPGSLGIEALLQLLEFDLRERGADADVARPRFEPIMLGQTVDWKYRGQVLPENDVVIVDVEITERGEDEHGPYVVGRGSLWVDGTRIYEAEGLGMRIVSAADDRWPVTRTRLLNPEVDTWLKDHRPTFTRPALPMMGIVDALAEAASVDAPGEYVTELRDVELKRWLVVDGPTELRTRSEPDGDGDWRRVELSSRSNGDDDQPAERRADQIASGHVRTSRSWPAPPPPLEPLNNESALEDPYESGAIFHGPAFRLLQRASAGESGASGQLDASAGDVPRGTLHPALLDAALHVIPHDDLQRWSEAVPPGTVAYPNRIEHLTLHRPTPEEGIVRVEVRFDGFERSERFPVFHIQYFADDELWADLRLVEVLFPKGRIARGSPEERRAFLRDRKFVPELGLSHFHGEETRLSVPEVRKNDWFEGTIAAVYDVDGDVVEQTRSVAIKDHFAQRLEVHPSEVQIYPDGFVTCRSRPRQRFGFRIAETDPVSFVVTSPDVP